MERRNIFILVAVLVTIAIASMLYFATFRNDPPPYYAYPPPPPAYQAFPYQKVCCTFTKEFSYFGEKYFETCLVTKNIDSETYTMASDINASVELFNISNNKQVEFLPRNIGKKLPNLKQFKAEYDGLTVVRDHYLSGMRQLQFLGLYHNEIKMIEANAFRDLIKVERMHLDYNLIETLDQGLFATMVELKYLNLNYNKIKFLAPTTFKISGGKLNYVELWSNVCVNKVYDSYYWHKLESDLEANCASS